ncbi:MAG: tetratricopeptide repeat protein [Pyrinomonadaceae bacterium]
MVKHAPTPTHMQDLIVIDSKNLRARAALLAVIVIALACGWITIKRQLGNMLATLTKPGDPNAAGIADIALSFSTGDPSAAWLKASTNNDLAMFEQTVRLAPNDYRWRAEFGRVLEQDEQPGRAEAEFKRAVELAPSFAFPRWRLANFYLRQDRVDEALAELKIAARNNQAYREQAFSLVWDLFKKDPATVETLAGDEPAARARLAYFFAGRGRPDEAVRIWNTLSEQDQKTNDVLAKGMAQGLYEQRRFAEALEFSRQAGLDPDSLPETVTNSSFEKGLNESTDSRFGWQVVRNDPKFDVIADPRVKQDGNRALRVTFRNFNKPELYNISQTVVVTPSTRYRLKFWVRTENLKSAGTPLVEIINANDDRLVARSSAFPSGTNDWQELTVDFMAPANSNAVNIRTARAYCGEGCPITGIFWYDSFELVKQ